MRFSISRRSQSVLEIGPTGYPSYYSEAGGYAVIGMAYPGYSEKSISAKGMPIPLHIVSEDEYQLPDCG